MRVIAKKALVEYGRKRPEAKGELEAWYAEAKRAKWRKPTDVTARYCNASILKGGRVVFDICGNRHRLVVWINYAFLTVYIRFIGTHQEYDAINAETI